MAIYHFSGTVISRSQGRSAVACAAYRSAEKLHDEKYDKVHDYTQKQDVAHTEILLPQNAPEKFKDRETLWNSVEAFEKRKDAQLAREFNFALPRELTLEQNISLAKEFVKETFVKEGMIADLCIHNDKGSDGQLHPHAHVMLTMREVNENGFGQKERAWNDKALLLSWREEWADIANKHLALHGHDLRIDHRSLAEQQIPLEPQYKIGTSVARDRLVRMEDHQRIARENGEKLLANPEIALHAITRQQSTFTHQDLARFVNRHTVDSEQFSQVYEKVKSCDELLPLGLDDKGRERFTTHEMLKLESQMMAHSVSLFQSQNHAVKESFQEKALLQKELTSEQKVAFDHLVNTGDLKCVVGFAGTGKSYLLGAAKDAWEAQGFNVSGVTLSGIAAENLEGSSGIESRTFASRSYFWDKGEERLTKNDVLVVDEAGMLSSRQMSKLMEVAHEGGAKVVLVGDPQQLQAIEAGAAFRSIAEKTHYVELTDIRRQAYEWQQEATKELARGEVDQAISRYVKHSNVHEFETKAFAKATLVEVWNDSRLANPSQSQIMLAYNRNDVLELNALARALRHQQKELGQDTLFQTGRGERAFAEGDRVYFLKNDRSLGVMNGTLGTVESIKEGVLTISVDKERNQGAGAFQRVAITMERYDQIDHGYAATIHKAQGVTVDRSYVLASQYLDAHSTYVAMSRHRESADLFYGKDTFLTKEDLVKTLGRDRAKDVTLDYLSSEQRKEYGEARGVYAQDKKEHVNHQQDKTQDSDRLLRQEKLREFTERTREERTVRPISDRSLGKSAREQGLRDLQDFKRQYEEKHKTSTKALTRDLELQRVEIDIDKGDAQKLVEKYQHLEEIVEKGGRSSHMAQDHLEKLADKMSRKKDVMAYVREHHPTIEKDINQMTKELQKERDFGLEL